MAWTPTVKVADHRGVVDNLLTYIEEQQSDAHLWANDSVPLPDYAGLYPNAAGRLTTKFPQLIVLNQEHQGEEGDGEVLLVTIALTLEVAVTGPNADQLVLDTKKYAMALESILANIPAASLMSGALNTTSSVLMKYQTVFDLVQGYGEKKASSFMQIFQTKCEFQLISSVF